MGGSNLWSCLCIKSRMRMYVFHVKHSMGCAATIDAQPQKCKGVDEASYRDGWVGVVLEGVAVLQIHCIRVGQ